MTTILFIGDPHFKVDNIPEVNLFMNKLEELAFSQKPDLICIGGDLLHTHEKIHTVPLNKSYELVDRMRKIAKTFVLVGNHDAINNQIFLTEDHWMNGMKEWENVTIVDKVVHYADKGVSLIFCPYVPNGRFQEALNTIGDVWKSADCIFAHQEFYGCKMGAIVSVDGDKWPQDYPYIVSGHIHSKQRPQENVYYTGSAMQHAFGESEENIIAFLTINSGDKYDIQEFDLKLPRKYIVYKTIDDMENFTPVESSDQVKVTILGNYEEFKAFKKTAKHAELLKTGTKIVFKPKKQKHKEETTENDFHKILSDSVNSEKNPHLNEVYELVVHNRIVSFFSETI